jgi:hypothetical protein
VLIVFVWVWEKEKGDRTGGFQSEKKSVGRKDSVLLALTTKRWNRPHPTTVLDIWTVAVKRSFVSASVKSGKQKAIKESALGSQVVASNVEATPVDGRLGWWGRRGGWRRGARERGKANNATSPPVTHVAPDTRKQHQQ